MSPRIWLNAGGITTEFVEASLVKSPEIFGFNGLTLEMEIFP